MSWCGVVDGKGDSEGFGYDLRTGCAAAKTHTDPPFSRTLDPVFRYFGGLNLKRAPRHLQPKTRKWVNSVLGEYELESHHAKLLTLAAEAWDRCQEARRTLAAEGCTYINRFNEPRAHPCVAIERDSRIAYARLLRELALDVNEPPESPRPPGLYK